MGLTESRWTPLTSANVPSIRGEQSSLVASDLGPKLLYLNWRWFIHHRIYSNRLITDWSQVRMRHLSRPSESDKSLPVRSEAEQRIEGSLSAVAAHIHQFCRCFSTDSLTTNQKAETFFRLSLATG